MEYRLYRDVRHPDMLMEIRLRLEDADMDIALVDTVAGIVSGLGVQVDVAIAALRQLIDAPLTLR